MAGLIIGVDPGNEASALVVLDERGVPSTAAKLPNGEITETLRSRLDAIEGEAPIVVIEQVRSYGMPVGAEVFDTVRWAGRFEQIAHDAECDVVLLPRLDVKTHLCHAANAKDSNIRQALLDRFGGKDRAIGVKATPGPLYGFKSDMWAALAVAVTQYDRTHADAPAVRAEVRRASSARRRARVAAAPDVVATGTEESPVVNVEFVVTDDDLGFPAINF